MTKRALSGSTYPLPSDTSTATSRPSVSSRSKAWASPDSIEYSMLIAPSSLWSIDALKLTGMARMPILAPKGL